MRVVITGASGNAGSALLRALAEEPAVREVVGIARRKPERPAPKTRWIGANVASDDMRPHFVGADAVVHLAWLIQPSRDLATLTATNVTGSERVFRAAAEAGVPALIYASSIGAYGPGPKERVPERWATNGIPTSFYSRHKAASERALDRVEREYPDMRVVRIRPGLIFQRAAASEIRRLFAGPLLPGRLLRASLIPFVPDFPGFAVQAVHADDVAEAYRLAIVRDDARGAYNVAAEPVLDARTIARMLRARVVPVSLRLLRGVAAATWRLRLQPTPPGWLDMAVQLPLMDITRAREELGWAPRRSATDALEELLAGMREGAGDDTPPLDPHAGGPGRVHEVLTGVGGRNP